MKIVELKNKTILLEEYNEYINFQKDCVIPNKVSAMHLLSIVKQEGTKNFIKELATKAINEGCAGLSIAETDEIMENLKQKLINELPSFEEWLLIKDKPVNVFK